MGRSRVAQMPAALTTARVLMFMVAGLSALWVVAFLVGYGVTSENVGAAMVQLLPGAFSFALAVKIRPERPRIRLWINILEVVWVLIAFGRIGQGDVTGVLGLILPGIILVLVNTRAARSYFVPGRYF
ncbi:hypothetical protein Arub01_04500 [Actinomadura rubrobrunea]|uniref:DUF2568 domain-containing protein n=2 Tax=Actinomadura rubrobrunea TaxID=115335 RepID=A0A9W6US22_9ACTN|nr:hypothetical protein Arub01_04500 [Actinomadura rubrobrunea]